MTDANAAPSVTRRADGWLELRAVVGGKPRVWLTALASDMREQIRVQAPDEEVECLLALVNAADAEPGPRPLGYLESAAIAVARTAGTTPITIWDDALEEVRPATQGDVDELVEMARAYRSLMRFSDKEAGRVNAALGKLGGDES